MKRVCLCFPLCDTVLAQLLAGDLGSPAILAPNMAPVSFRAGYSGSELNGQMQTWNQLSGCCTLLLPPFVPPPLVEVWQPTSTDTANSSPLIVTCSLPTSPLHSLVKSSVSQHGSLHRSLGFRSQLWISNDLAFHHSNSQVWPLFLMPVFSWSK